MNQASSDDLARLAIEITTLNDGPEEWAEKQGIGLEVIEQMGQMMTNTVFDQIKEAVTQHAEEVGLEGLEEEAVVIDGRKSIEVRDINMPDLIVNVCVNSFIMGFEFHKQYGKRDM